MANCHRNLQPRVTALSDPHLSPQAVALAAALISGGDSEKLGLHPKAVDLAVWELERSGHIGGGA